MKDVGLTLQRRLGLVRSVPAFSRLSHDEQLLLVETMGIRRLKAGEVLFRRGDSGHEAFLVADGELSATLGEAGRSIERARLGPGRFFGELSMFAGQRRTLTVTALRPSVLLALPHQRLEALLMLRTEIAVSLLKELVGKLVALEETLVP